MQCGRVLHRQSLLEWRIQNFHYFTKTLEFLSNIKIDKTYATTSKKKVVVKIYHIAFFGAHSVLQVYVFNTFINTLIYNLRTFVLKNLNECLIEGN